MILSDRIHPYYRGISLPAQLRDDSLKMTLPVGLGAEEDRYREEDVDPVSR